MILNMSLSTTSEELNILLDLEQSGVDLHRNVIRLQAEHTKLNAPRVIPLCNEARKAVGRQALTAQQHSRSHCRDQGLKDLSFYRGVNNLHLVAAGRRRQSDERHTKCSNYTPKVTYGFHVS